MGNYQYTISDRRGRVYRKGEIKDFARNSKDVLNLLHIVLTQEGYAT